MEQLVFNMQRYCYHDGPGIRTVVFIKGCPLRCQWCSNPESQNFNRELTYKELTCIKCGICVDKCPYQALKIKDNKLELDRQRCQLCDVCSENCCTKSLEILGQSLTIENIIQNILKDKAYYDISNGGVTISGGEPLAQKQFCKEILTELKKENIHTAVETCGYVDMQTIIETIPLIDLFLYDIKHPFSEPHILGTGKDNKLILDNLNLLVSSGATIIIRYPLIPGFNSEPKTLNAVADLMIGLGLNEINILPYHRLGSEKYKHLGRTYERSDLAPPDKDTLLFAKEYLLKKGIERVNLF